jgi:DNA-binding MarR family transcriptional regulator
MTDSQQISLSIRQFLETVTSRSMHDWMIYVKGTGLSMPQFGVLMRLYHGGSCAVSEIGRHMDITNAAASQLIDGLVAKGLLVRVENPVDRRAKQISISQNGRELIETGMNERFRWVEELVAELDSEEQKLVINALPALLTASLKLSISSGHG